jgi:FMN phosphatase YigB (HAD superfamily)
VDEVRRAAREAGCDVAREVAATAFDAAWERHMRLWSEGVATGAPEIALWALAELGLREPHPSLEHLVDRFQNASHSSRVLVLEGARETLDELRRAGVACALVCDTGLTPGSVVRRHLERHGLLCHLDVQVFSDEVVDRVIISSQCSGSPLDSMLDAAWSRRRNGSVARTK